MEDGAVIQRRVVFFAALLTGFFQSLVPGSASPMKFFDRHPGALSGKSVQVMVPILVSNTGFRTLPASSAADEVTLSECQLRSNERRPTRIAPDSFS